MHAPLPPAALTPLPILEGRRVDTLVRQLLRGVVIPRDAGLPAAIDDTARLVAAGLPARVHQAAFRAGEL
ncbi:MAG: hypothetical protein RL684_647, partial [Pseudomonadota bacterium]